MSNFRLKMEGLRCFRRNPWIDSSINQKIRFAGEWYERRSSSFLWRKYESLKGNSDLSWFLKRFLK